MYTYNNIPIKEYYALHKIIFSTLLAAIFNSDCEVTFSIYLSYPNHMAGKPLVDHSIVIDYNKVYFTKYQLTNL